ncbi:riboflavin synthase [Treponema sp. J25]|uniref:riboflavin synthase n=1 Tax=Treponema sp. J25 TaxID=2094121 RepID=UPI00104967DB|nr:riboflavin synthase [Treponema sp. J25]TCW60877.1 riboflavin synthase [Treponema sp. J25]
MFTGIIKEIGYIQNVYRGTHSLQLQIRCQKTLSSLTVGESVAVNGVCLTVIRREKSFFEAQVMRKTLERTTLTNLSSGTAVNLEPALSLSSFLGGHFVTGHVDGVGWIEAIHTDDIAHIVTIRIPPELAPYLAPRGSVALDGVSLTVAAIENLRIEISLVPHTWQNTTFQHRNVGDPINVECDILARYVEQLLRPPAGGGKENRRPFTPKSPFAELLRKGGFLDSVQNEEALYEEY